MAQTLISLLKIVKFAADQRLLDLPGKLMRLHCANRQRRSFEGMHSPKDIVTLIFLNSTFY